MKALLRISLLLNLALLLWVGGRKLHDREAARIAHGQVAEQKQGSSSRRPAVFLAPASVPWAGVESRDPARLIDNLRAVGCPEQTIRELITLRVSRAFRERFVAAEAGGDLSWESWRHRTTRQWLEKFARQRQFRAERDGELERLLQTPADQLTAGVMGYPMPARDRSYLPLQKQDKVRQITLRYEALADEASSGLLPWETEPEVEAELKRLNGLKQAEFGQALSPDELAELNLRESGAARYVLKHLPEARSEAEFKQMVRAVEEVGIEESKAAAGRQVGAVLDPEAEQQEQQYRAREKLLAARLKELLGEQRTAEQQQEEQMRQAQEKERERQRDEQRERARLVAVAESIGASGDDANRFMDRIKELQPAMERKYGGELEKAANDPEKAKALKLALRADLEALAMETMGEKGLQFVRKAMNEDGADSEN